MQTFIFKFKIRFCIFEINFLFIFFQIIFDGFSVGRFDEGVVDGESDATEASLTLSGELPGCPEGFMQVNFNKILKIKLKSTEIKLLILFY